MSNFKTALLGTAAVALAAAAFAAPAAAADNANVVRSSFGDKVQVKVTGQINRGILFADDGEETTVKHVDNDSSSSRFRIHADGKVTSDFSVGGIFELEVQQNSSNDADQDTFESDVHDSLMDRRVEVFFTSKKFGRVYVGKGPTASDGTAESNVNAAGVLGVGGLMELSLGGLQARTDAGALAGDDAQIGDFFTNFDGLSRRNRVRYDTPVVAGFQAGVDHIDGNAWDAALKWKGSFMGVKAAAAVAYWNDANIGNQGDGINGSFDVLTPFGIFFGASAGKTDPQGTDKNGNADPKNIYAHVGYQQKFFEIGTTAVRLAYMNSKDITKDGDEGKLYEIGLVQHIDAAATEVFAAYDHADLERTNTSLQDADVFRVGARIRF